MQRIALISEHASPLAAPGSVDSGGQNVYVAHVSSELSKLGYLVDIYTRRDRPCLQKVVDWKPGVRIIHVPAGPASALPKEAMLPYMPTFATFMHSFIHRHQLRYQLVHANFFMSGMVALQLKLVLGLPFVITFHALGRVRRQYQGDADGFPDERFEIEEALMQEAACVIAECEQDLHDMRSLYGARRDNIAMVPCGFDPDEFSPMREAARARLGLPDSEFVVLQLGRMVPRKGIDNVIRALAVLRDRCHIRGTLWVVGGDHETDHSSSSEIRRLRQLAESLHLSQQVSFRGAQPRAALREFYSAADVFVTTPWYEPFGITPLEAMACATPVIGSDVGGIRSTVVCGETGYRVPPNGPEALAERLAMLQQNPRLARQMGWNGLRRAHRHFTWRRVTHQLADLYESVIRSSARAALMGIGQPDSVGEDTGIAQ